MIQDSVRVWKELSSLYEEADALDDVDLANFLQVLEAQGNPLLTSLRRMLNARSSVAENDFLGRAPSLPIAPEIDPLRWQTGTGVGPYRLVRHLGSGGMAEVWLAERADGAFERTVAIKLLFDHPSRARRENFVERFKRERDILAGLDHPRIARLHDAGVTPTGQSWLALEAVDGEMITKWCDRERLTVEQRVRLFREVLDAVEHAHARLVIHRDIKPSNVLVGKDGTVRLLDFGISKLLEVPGQAQGDTALTQHGGRPLTPEYASPEQKRGESAHHCMRHLLARRVVARASRRRATPFRAGGREGRQHGKPLRCALGAAKPNDRVVGLPGPPERGRRWPETRLAP